MNDERENHWGCRFTSPGGYYCQNCSRVLLERQGGICDACQALLKAAADPPANYDILKSTGSETELVKMVALRMSKGWAPHGNLVIAAHFDSRNVFVIEFYQPMVRVKPVVDVAFPVLGAGPEVVDGSVDYFTSHSRSCSWICTGGKCNCPFSFSPVPFTGANPGAGWFRHALGCQCGSCNGGMSPVLCSGTISIK